MTQDIAGQTESDQPLPKFALRFANMVFAMGIAICFFAVIYAIYRIYVPFHDFHVGNKEYEKIHYYYILIGIISAILFCLGLRLRDSLKVNMSLVISALGISVYSLEVCLELAGPLRKLEAAQQGLPYDPRSYEEVIQDLRDEGVKAYPNILPGYFRESNGLAGDSGRVFPLGGISNITTAFWNEGGYFPIIEADEYGFNNPKGLYNKGEVDIVLTGDSFTEGLSVNADENISAVLRKSGLNVVNLGKSGNGPLTEYAALKEYAEPIEPKVVLWMFFKNDFIDLPKEIKSPLLMKYLNEDNFSQNLSSRQIEIDRMLVKYADQEWTTNDSERDNRASRSLTNIIKLYNLRMLVYPNGIYPAPNHLNTVPKYPNTLFARIMEKGKKLTSSWGGKLYHVYLPSSSEVKDKGLDDFHEYVLRTMIELDIPVIDVYKEVFSSHADPHSLFPQRTGYHYNAEGYRLVAEAIAKRLKEDGFIPSSLEKKITDGVSAQISPE